jgi:hypothetical protein
MKELQPLWIFSEEGMVRPAGCVWEQGSKAMLEARDRVTTLFIPAVPDDCQCMTTRSDSKSNDKDKGND